MKLFTRSVSISCSVRLEQGTVTSLLEEKGTITGVQYKSKNGEQKTAYAPLTIVCDGCFSNLRRSLCTPMVRRLQLYAVVPQNRHLLSLRICDWLQNDLPTASKQWISFSISEPFYLLYLLQVDVPSFFVGLVLENCQLPYANLGHVVLGDPSPILFYPISSTEIRCLVDVPGQKVPSISNGEMEKYLKTVVAPQVQFFQHSHFMPNHVF